MRPLIGIPCHAGLREGSGRPIYCNNRSYVHAVESAGGIPVLIPLLNDLSALDSLLTRMDGLLMPGGIDVQPHLYSEDPHPLLGEVDPALDELELTLARWALNQNIPVMGICRGMQLLNVALGGSLYQDVNYQVEGTMRHMYRDVPRNQLIHKVTVEQGTLLEKIFEKREFGVNSIHHQSVKTPGKGVKISARSLEDDVVEGIEAADYRFVVAVQWHPEELYEFEPACANLFAALIEACQPAMHDVTVPAQPTTIVSQASELANQSSDGDVVAGAA